MRSLALALACLAAEASGRRLQAAVSHLESSISAISHRDVSAPSSPSDARRTAGKRATKRPLKSIGLLFRQLQPEVATCFHTSWLAVRRSCLSSLRQVFTGKRHDHDAHVLSDESEWSGNMSQEEFMIKDQCILVGQDDSVIGNDNKRASHTFDKEHPRALLHRAFSVFLFDSKGRLLLQQRASDKITFPNVWTNTCCSHQLHGYSPTEVDNTESVQNGTVMGSKRAAVRKLLQELGIDAAQVPIEKFKYLTRVHYWAADVVTHGRASPWGEHEIDYMLFIQADVDVNPNPEEVRDYKWVTAAELKEMMDPANGLLWSPWFRIIAEKFLLPCWWTDLQETLTTDKWVDLDTIHRFDPTAEHMGGAGDAGEWLGRAESYKPTPQVAAS